ncbi:MAG: hypothetical protein AB1631_22125 [Acidobacteriota bacterium]
MGESTNNRLLLKRKAEMLTEAETAAVLDYISMIESLREPPARDNPFDDDILHTLEEARENRRARVVFEWDRIRRRADNFAVARKIS